MNDELDGVKQHSRSAEAERQANDHSGYDGHKGLTSLNCPL
jgi:hypothetical protein